jgi:hypothetical protein
MQWLANFTYPALHFVDILRNFRQQAEIFGNCQQLIEIFRNRAARLWNA